MATSDETKNNTALDYSDAILDKLTDLNINLTDLEDIFSSNTTGFTGMDAKDISHGGLASDEYRRAGTFLTNDGLKKYFQKILAESYRLMGQGSNVNQLQLFLSRLDRHGTVITPLNTINQGFTFITRPRLNLTRANLRQHPILNTLDANDPSSVAFAIRALLDTRLSRGSPLTIDYAGDMRVSDLTTNEISDFGNKCAASPLFDYNNPFFTPLCNGLKGISGFPDFNIETETTEGDFHSGDLTFAKGSDMNNRTQELSLEFRDVQGSIILSCFYYWCLYMALQAKGVVMAYQDDIYLQRLNYTVSIYRFLMDPARKTILWWAKATGCFPKSVPIGALFNTAQGEEFISSATNFSIPFTANDVKVNDPGILLDFNALVKRYCPTIESSNFQDVDVDTSATTAGLNFIGLPYIRDTSTGLKFVWRTSSHYLATAGLASGFDNTTGEASDATEWDNYCVEAQYSRLDEVNRILSALGVEESSSASSATTEDTGSDMTLAAAQQQRLF